MIAHENPQHGPKLKDIWKWPWLKGLSGSPYWTAVMPACLKGLCAQAPGQALEIARVILGTTLEPPAGRGTLCVPLSSCWVLAGP